jgi:hypothetical protein
MKGESRSLASCWAHEVSQRHSSIFRIGAQPVQAEESERESETSRSVSSHRQANYSD